MKHPTVLNESSVRALIVSFVIPAKAETQRLCFEWSGVAGMTASQIVWRADKSILGKALVVRGRKLSTALTRRSNSLCNQLLEAAVLESLDSRLRSAIR